MSVTIIEILEVLDGEAPFSLAEKWDNVGLLVGNAQTEVTGVLAGLDPTLGLLDEAIAKNINTIITHHPVIFKPLSSINTGDSAGKLLQKALAADIALIACHTNFDSASDGVNDRLGRCLGLTGLQPLVAGTVPGDATTGLGRLGRYDVPLSGAAFMQKILEVLGLESVQLAGQLPEKIVKVGLCGGSGSEFAAVARQRGCDVYLSAEIKHSTAVWAVENNFCVMDGTHYATEKPAVSLLVEKLQQAAEKQGWSLPIVESETEKHPMRIMNTSSFSG